MADRPVALVTGASRGIGAAIARSLAPSHDLLLGGRDIAALAKLADELPCAQPWPVELTDSAALKASTSDIARLDVLVHSAAVVTVQLLADTSAKAWRELLDVNVIAVAELTRLLLPVLRSVKGQVILINSGAGLKASRNWGSYSASKFALRAYADALRDEEPQIRVTTIYPGRTATDMQRTVRNAEGGEFQPDRYLRPDSVAQAVLAAVTATPDAHLTELILRPRG